MNRKILTILAMAVATGAFAQGLRNLNRTARTRPQPAPAASAAAAKSDSSDGEAKEAPALNWEQAPVDIVLQAYGEQLGKTILKDPGVPNANISLKSREGQKLLQEEYLEAIEVVLEMNGVHVEPYGEKFIRALPRAKVRKDGVPLYMDISEVPESYKDGRVISVRIVLKNIGTEEAQKALEGFKSDSGLLQVFERTNSILITDTWQNIQRMDEIVRSLDVATPVLENVFVRQIKNASAADIKTALEQIVQESQKQLEKDKGANNSTAQSAAPAPLFGSRLHNRNQPQQQQQAVNNASLVMSVSDADRGMIRGKVLIIADERSNKLVIITQKSNMDFFDKVIEQLDIETTPDTVVKVYRLKYADSEDVSDMINDLIGNTGKSNSKGNQNANAKNGSGANMTRNTATQPKKNANQRSGEAKAGELTKDNTTVLSDKRINGLVVMTEKELVPTIEQIIESMDVKLSQVLIETVIIEVSLGDGLETGVDWVQNGRFHEDGTWTTQTKTDAYGRTYGYYQNDEDPSTVKEMLDATAESGWTRIKDVTESIFTSGGVTKNTLWSGNNAYSQLLGGGANAVNAANLVTGVASNLFGSALNYVFKSDALNLSAIIQATKTDNRAKYIASPIVMTVDNKEATIEATQARKFLSNYQSSSVSSSLYGSSIVPQYENKDLGIKIKVTPKINPNGTVMLNIEEEYSQLGAKQSILDPNSNPVSIDTALTRKMSADALLENHQTVVLCGLTETKTTESLTGIPILMDIPWIGKWLFSKVSESEDRSELMIFMTPYVLNDGESAQAEALRRKKALSDATPWDDHGWSKSELADPVSKKEQLRRLKDEWKKQDEERKTRIAIEKEKVNRVKKLQEMDEEERDLWLEMHKEELEDEAKDELEKKMEDPESQEELKKLAAQVRARSLKEAEEAAKKAEDDQKQRTEDGKAAEKAAREAKPAEDEAAGQPAGELKPAEEVKPEGEVKVE